MTVETKTCKECKKTFPKTREFFQSNGKNQLKVRCKPCRKKRIKELTKQGVLKDRTPYYKERNANKPKIKKINRRTYLRRKIKQGTIKDDEKVELELLVEELKNWK